MGGDFTALPWAIGSTFFNGGTADATSGGNWEGREFLIPALNYSSAQTPPLSGLTGHEMVRIKIVRNVSGVALLPGLLVVYKASVPGGQVDGYTRVSPTLPAGVVDPYLPAAGVPNNDLFYIVTEGLVLAKFTATASEAAALAAGDFLHTVTAAASTHSTTAGRFLTAVTSGATGVLAASVLNVLGVAVSAGTTADAGASRLIRLRKLL